MASFQSAVNIANPVTGPLSLPSLLGEAKRGLDRPEHREKRAMRAAEAEQEKQLQAADLATRAASEAAEAEARLRRSNILRNQTIVVDPLGLGGQAATVRKILTGQ